MRALDANTEWPEEKTVEVQARLVKAEEVWANVSRAEAKLANASRAEAKLANVSRAEVKLANASRAEVKLVGTAWTQTGQKQAEQAQAEIVKRPLLREHRLEIYVNEQLTARLVCTAEHLEDLVVGRLVTEGIIQDAEEIELFYLCESGNRARVFLRGDVRFCPKEAEEPTCCTDNHIYLKRADEQAERPQRKGKQSWDREQVFRIIKAFSDDSALHKSTGGTHSCLLAAEDEIVYRAEDIGRHNALDKAIGYAVRNKLDRGKCVLFTTGRVPTDMVRKVVAAGMPVLVSKAVPTFDAVEMAEESGLVLICRAWPDSFEVYG